MLQQVKQLHPIGDYMELFNGIDLLECRPEKVMIILVVIGQDNGVDGLLIS